MEIQNNVFVVTGGGSGLGAATARQIVARGGKVVLADVNAQAGEALAAELGAAARFVATDVTDEASAQAAFAAATAMGPLRGLVNCAGVAPAEKVVGKEGAHKLASFTRTVTINLIGTFNMTRLAAEIMSKSEPDEGGERGVPARGVVPSAGDGDRGGQGGQQVQGRWRELLTPPAHPSAGPDRQPLNRPPGAGKNFRVWSPNEVVRTSTHPLWGRRPTRSKCLELLKKRTFLDTSGATS